MRGYLVKTSAILQSYVKKDLIYKPSNIFEKIIDNIGGSRYKNKCNKVKSYLGSTRSSEFWKFMKLFKNKCLQTEYLPNIEKWMATILNKGTWEYKQLNVLSSAKQYRITGQHLEAESKIILKLIKIVKILRAYGREGIHIELRKKW